MVFSSQSHISTFKLGLRLSVWDRENPVSLLLSFRFETAAYCLLCSIITASNQG